MSEINIIYNWKNKEIKNTLTKDEESLLLEAIHSKVELSVPKYKELERKIVGGLLGCGREGDYLYVSDGDNLDEIKEILKRGIDLNYKLRIDITLD